MLGNRATPERVAQLHEQWGLDQPLPVQYWISWSGSCTATSATRCSTASPSATLIDRAAAGDALAARLRHAALVLIAVPLATLAATRARTARSTTSSAPCRSSGSACPPFWLGIMLILLFGAAPRAALPGRRLRRRRSPATSTRMFLPALTVALGIVADPDPQPAREPARGARVRLHHDRARRRAARAARARPPRAAQRDHLDGHRARRQHRLPGRRHAGRRAGLRAAGHRAADDSTRSSSATSRSCRA